MKNALFNLIEKVKTSFWFFPLLMILLSIVLAESSLQLDHILQDKAAKEKSFGVFSTFLFSGGVQSAQTILSVIASSMATAISLVISMTMVTFTLASSQYGPRLLRNFIASQKSQLILGMFMGAFIFAIYILRSLHSADASVFIPKVAITVATVLGVFSFILLIYFLHYVAVSLRVESLVASVGKELASSIDRIYPEVIEASSISKKELYEIDELELSKCMEKKSDLIRAKNSGYIQSVNYEQMAELCVNHAYVLEVLCRPGHFVLHNQPLARVYFQDGETEQIKETVVKELIKDFTIGENRTPTQDIEFSMDQLIEVALVALSPGVNKTYTAIACIDRLGEAVATLSARYLQSPLMFKNDILCLIRHQTDYNNLVSAAFNQIRQNSMANPAISIHLLRTIQKIMPQVKSLQALESLEDQAKMILETLNKECYALQDQHDLESEYEKVENIVQYIDKTQLFSV